MAQQDPEMWQAWEQRIRQATRQAEAHGARELTPLSFLPPVPKSQVRELEENTGLTLPPDFAGWLTQHCGGFEFSWDLDETDTPLGDYVSGGNSEVPFVGATPTDTLLSQYAQFQEELRECALYGDQWNDAPDILETRDILTRCFPLYLFYGGGGDYWVLRCDVQPAQVLYLDHELFYQTTDKAVIGVGFREFMDTWTLLGCPEFNTYSPLLNPDTLLLDATTETSVAWAAWLEQA